MSIWNFNADSEINFHTPLAIVRNLCDELSQISRGRVIARVTEYDGKYQSGQIVRLSEVFADRMPFSTGTLPAFNVQEVMGDKATDDEYSNNFVYELFLTSKSTPKYKYRVFIMHYSISMYPVGLTIQEDIAKEVMLDSETTRCNDETEFMKALERILGSNTVGSVLNSLVALNS